MSTFTHSDVIRYIQKLAHSSCVPLRGGRFQLLLFFGLETPDRPRSERPSAHIPGVMRIQPSALSCTTQ